MVNDITWKIKNDNENTSLDFKKIQYTKEKYPAFIKDVMSMANAPIDGSRYIIIGVKEHPNGNKEFYSIDDTIDVATYEQLIRNNIEPTINIDFFTLNIESSTIGVFEIKDCINPPYMMKKDNKYLNKGDCFIRRGTQQERIIRRELDEIFDMKGKFQFDNKIVFGFKSEMKNKIDLKATKSISFPSERKKIELEEQLEELLRKEEIVDLKEKEINPFSDLPLFKGLTSTINGVSLYQQPTKSSLEKEIATVSSNYRGHDNYYLKELMSNKLNFYIQNNSNAPLNDVKVIIKFPISIGSVIENLPIKPIDNASPFGLSMTIPSVMNGYPDVEKKINHYIVTDEMSLLRHKQTIKLFYEDLRVFIPQENIGKVFSIDFEIHATNLPDPIHDVLSINVL